MNKLDNKIVKDELNQFFSLSGNILEVTGETKRKNATLKILIPNDFAQKLMKQMLGNNQYDDKNNKLLNIQLCWTDTGIIKDTLCQTK